MQNLRTRLHNQNETSNYIINFNLMIQSVTFTSVANNTWKNYGTYKF